MTNNRSTTPSNILTGALLGILTRQQLVKLDLIAKANDLHRTDIIVYADEVKHA